MSHAELAPQVMKTVIAGVEMFVYEMDGYQYDSSESYLMAHLELLTLEEILLRCSAAIAPRTLPSSADLRRIGFVDTHWPRTIALWKDKS